MRGWVLLASVFCLSLAALASDISALSGQISCTTVQATCAVTLSAPGVLPRDSASAFFVKNNGGTYSTLAVSGYSFTEIVSPPSTPNVVSEFDLSFTFANWDGTSPLVIPNAISFVWWDGTQFFFHPGAADAVLDSFNGTSLKGHFSWPVPEPATFLLFAVGAVPLLRRVRLSQ